MNNPDYYVSNVNYTENPKRVDLLRAWKHVDAKMTDPKNYARDVIVDAIDRGTTFSTAYKENGTWSKGADVQVVVVGKQKFLRTDANAITEDNLGKLPPIPAA